MIPACAHCPVAEGVCRARPTGHARYCEQMDPARPGHDPAAAARLAGLLRGETPPDAPPAPMPPAPPVPIDPVALAIDLCPSRRSCSCSPTIDCATRGWVDKVAVCRPCPDKNRP